MSSRDAYRAFAKQRRRLLILILRQLFRSGARDRFSEVEIFELAGKGRVISIKDAGREPYEVVLPAQLEVWQLAIQLEAVHGR